MNEKERYHELLACLRKAAPGHCAIIDDNTHWEGVRWTETLPNGDYMILGGMKVQLHTAFLTCEEHTPKDA